MLNAMFESLDTNMMDIKYLIHVQLNSDKNELSP